MSEHVCPVCGAPTEWVCLGCYGNRGIDLQERQRDKDRIIRLEGLVNALFPFLLSAVEDLVIVAHGDHNDPLTRESQTLLKRLRRVLEAKGQEGT